MEDINLEIDTHSYEPLRIQVYKTLREAIINGGIKPGKKISELEIADKLNVSRTPVREAFHMLELEDLIIIIPQKGVFVAGIKSKKEINDIFLVRMELEGLAAALAAKNISQNQIEKLNNYINQIKKCIQIDISFHNIIKEASDNKWLEKNLDNLFEQITRFRAKSLGKKGRMEEALTEHKKLGIAISEGNSELAQKLAREHIQGAWDSVISVFEDDD